eukprot:380631-Rhodomonas_salina.2
MTSFQGGQACRADSVCVCACLPTALARSHGFQYSLLIKWSERLTRADLNTDVRVSERDMVRAWMSLSTTSAPPPRQQHGLAALNGKLYTFGGVMVEGMLTDTLKHVAPWNILDTRVTLHSLQRRHSGQADRRTRKTHRHTRHTRHARHIDTIPLIACCLSLLPLLPCAMPSPASRTVHLR